MASLRKIYRREVFLCGGGLVDSRSDSRGDSRFTTEGSVRPSLSVAAGKGIAEAGFQMRWFIDCLGEQEKWNIRLVDGVSFQERPPSFPGRYFSATGKISTCGGT